MLIPAYQFRRQMLRIRRAATIAEKKQFMTIRQRTRHCFRHFGNRLDQFLIFQKCLLQCHARLEAVYNHLMDRR